MPVFCTVPIQGAKPPPPISKIQNTGIQAWSFSVFSSFPIQPAELEMSWLGNELNWKWVTPPNLFLLNWKWVLCTWHTCAPPGWRTIALTQTEQSMEIHSVSGKSLPSSRSTVKAIIWWQHVQEQEEEHVDKQELHECNAYNPTWSPKTILGNISNAPIQALQQTLLLPLLLIQLHFQKDLRI